MESSAESTNIETKPDRTVWFVVGGCLLILCLGALFIVLGWRLYGSQLNSLIERQPEETVPTETPSIVTEVTSALPDVEIAKDSNALGDPNAPVIIIQYSDFQCPYCERYWRETEPQIIENYVNTGKVYYIYRSMGAFIGPESQSSAEAAYCAGDQGKFWQYHDMLYENQAGENRGAFSRRNLLKFAETLQLDLNQFSDCLDSGKYTEQVKQDQLNAQSSGVQGTPSFLINGILIAGAQPYQTISSVIDAELEK